MSAVASWLSDREAGRALTKCATPLSTAVTLSWFTRSPSSTNRWINMSRSRRIARAFAVAVAVVAVGFGAQRADAALVASANLGARPSVTCWADIGYPNHVGSNVVSFNDWQCSPGIEQQISLVASLTYQDGTRYQFTKTCYSTQSCSVNPMSAPWQSGT